MKKFAVVVVVVMCAALTGCAAKNPFEGSAFFTEKPLFERQL